MRTVVYLIGALALLWVVGSTGHIPGTPVTPPAATAPQGTTEPADPGCQATQVASDGTPPPGTPRLDPQKLCDALDHAEHEAACMGDYQPPDPVNARQFCLDVQHRGCGDPARDCGQIPADQTYYTHH